MVSIESSVPFFYDDMSTSAFFSSGPYLHGLNFAGLIFCRQVQSIEEADITLFLFLFSFFLARPQLLNTANPSKSRLSGMIHNNNTNQFFDRID